MDQLAIVFNACNTYMFQADHHSPCAQESKVTSLNDSIAMKCFERLIMGHNTIIPENLAPLQFTYHPNRSTDDAISTTLHTVLSHLDKRHIYVRMLFIDYNIQHHSAYKAHH